MVIILIETTMILMMILASLVPRRLGVKGIGGNLKERATAVLFQYSDDNYDHLYNEDIDKVEKRVENSDSNKRVKGGCGRYISSQTDRLHPTTTG